MSLIFIDGFDHYATANMLTKWDTVVSTAAISTSGPRNGAGCLSIPNTAAYVAKTLPAPVSTLIVGMGITISDLSAMHRLLTLLAPDGTEQVAFEAAVTTGLIQAYRGNAATLLGTSSAGITGSWQHVEFKVLIHDSAGTIDVRINGVSVLTLTGLDTRQHASVSTAQSIKIGLGSSASGRSMKADDLYVCDNSGSINNDFLGDVKVATLFPTAEGNSSAFTPSTGTDNAALVDDPLVNTTDYVTSSAADQVDTYVLGNLSSVNGVIHGVQVSPTATKTDPGVQNIEAVVRVGSTDYVLDEQTLGYGSWRCYPDIAELNPATTAAWTVAEVNAMEAGFASRT